MAKYLLNLQEFPGLPSVSEEKALTLGLPRTFDSLKECEAFGDDHDIEGYNLNVKVYATPGDPSYDPNHSGDKLIGHYNLMRSKEGDEGHDCDSFRW